MANPTFEQLKADLQKDGIVIIRNFISVEDANEIRKNIETSVDNDLQEREKAQQIYGRFEGSAGVTHNNSGKHIITDYFGRSSKLDQAMGKIFEDENTSRLLKFIGGDNLKLRGYNTRRMNGSLEYSAMEWHRDNVGEFTIGVVLSESGKTNDSATCYIPGSHLYPFCPFAKAKFTMPHPIQMPPWPLRFFSSLLEKKTTAKAQDAVGRPGDIYIFLGDLWHGRRPNFVANHDVVFFIGLFPSEIPFPGHSKVEIPSTEILQKLPKALREVVDFRNTPENKTKDSYFYQVQKQKQSMGIFTLWRLVQFENWIWKPFNRYFQYVENRIHRVKYLWGRVVGKIRRTLTST